MNKTELIAVMAEKTGFSKKDSEKALSAFAEAVTEALRDGDKVQLMGFGSFETKKRAERTGRNPKTNEPMVIPASRAPQFKPGKALKDAVGE